MIATENNIVQFKTSMGALKHLYMVANAVTPKSVDDVHKLAMIFDCIEATGLGFETKQKVITEKIKLNQEGWSAWQSKTKQAKDNEEFKTIVAEIESHRAEYADELKELENEFTALRDEVCTIEILADCLTFIDSVIKEALPFNDGEIDMPFNGRKYVMDLSKLLSDLEQYAGPTKVNHSPISLPDENVENVENTEAF